MDRNCDTRYAGEVSTEADQSNMASRELTQVRREGRIVELGSTPVERACAYSNLVAFGRAISSFDTGLREPHENSLIRWRDHLADDLRSVMRQHLYYGPNAQSQLRSDSHQQ